ncbi:Kelch repeat-containing protein [Kribbella solani]|uniref:Kelch-like protein 17 n=1 Tax=Kribbella solani TaxID=236067 RepID=A0A841DPI6_9ACTN|nr:kelch repeat-containing protein [Kribbella solani]MBB5977368.1 hypothetical protein [Kribbella solani]
MADPAWTAAADLPIAGWWAGQTSLLRLKDREALLLTGGEDSRRQPLGASWIYEAGAWHATGPVVLPRRLAGVTLLGDGRVLVTGGLIGEPTRPEVPTAAAEIFDPVAEKWTVAGALQQARFAHTATSLPDGRVLVAGGNAIRSADSNRALRSVEIFNPGSGASELVEPMTDPRFAHIDVPLLDGRILLVGGAVVAGPGLYGAQALCELYQPSTGLWTATGNLEIGRKGHQATRLLDGSVLVSGGDGRGLQSWEYERYSQTATEVFEPDKGTWKRVGEMAWGRSHHRDVLLPSGRVLQVGGTDSGSFDAGYRNAAVYDPATSAWTETVAPTVGRFGFAAGLVDGRVLIAGGLNRSGAATFAAGADVVTASAECYQGAS